MRYKIPSTLMLNLRPYVTLIKNLQFSKSINEIKEWDRERRNYGVGEIIGDVFMI